MSKFIYIHYRSSEAQLEEETKNKLHKIFCNSNGKFSHYCNRSINLFILNKTANVIVKDNLDYYLTLPSAGTEKYTYQSIKHSNLEIEVKGDLIGSRTIWYYADKEKFILSSSQRAIVGVLGSYEPNYAVWTWMLSNGTIGPAFSWDKRITALQAGATLLFNTNKWNFNIHFKDWKFSNENRPASELTKDLNYLVNEVKKDYQLNDVKTLLTLSGGYDSRAALYLLKENQKIETATWGIPASFTAPMTDASVARSVSNTWHINHKEYNVQLKGGFDQLLETFLFFGEGRNDHINSFMDGLDMWKRIANEGYEWVIRADEAFGWLPVRSDMDVRTSVSCAFLSDFSNIPPEIIRALPDQQIPDYLLRQDEQLEDYRDRLYQQYRLPFVICPLQDPPLSYVEMHNPLLHPKFIEFARSLPTHLRTSKKLYANWVDTLLPDVPYAQMPSIPEAYSIAESAEHEELFQSFFYDKETKGLFGTDFVSYLQQNWRSKKGSSEVLGSSFSRRAKKLLPVGLKKFIRNKMTGYQLKPSSLALRALIIYKMQGILKKDAN